jgi:hypothetical protein
VNPSEQQVIALAVLGTYNMQPRGKTWQAQNCNIFCPRGRLPNSPNRYLGQSVNVTFVGPAAATQDSKIELTRTCQFRPVPLGRSIGAKAYGRPVSAKARATPDGSENPGNVGA